MEDQPVAPRPMRTKYELAHWTTDSTGKEVIDFQAYQGAIHGVIRKFLRGGKFHPLMNRNEYYDHLYGECSVAFAKAVHYWNADRNIMFMTYLMHCLYSQMDLVINHMHRNKRRVRNRFISLTDFGRNNPNFDYDTDWEPETNGDLNEDFDVNEKLSRLIARLEKTRPMWAKVMQLRHYDGMTLDAVAKIIERTRERVRQIECAALSCLCRWARFEREQFNRELADRKVS